MSNRFTIDGSDALEQELARICAEVREAVLKIIPSRKIAALLLGGGYGRGEGGVLRMGEGDKPYNDLEFYILLSSGNATHMGFFPSIASEMFYAGALHRFSEEISGEIGVEVELKVLPLRKLERSPVTMFYYDLVTGHRLLYGAESWLARCDQHRAGHRIPLHEATRLLMNRCSGLLYSQAKLEQQNLSGDDADFVGRNLAKAKLAFGDVLLAMRGQYHWSCRERQKRLRKLDADGALHNFSSIAPLHSQGVEFKLHPVRTDRKKMELRSELDFLKDIAAQLWLQIESRRLNQPFSSLGEYAFSPLNKCPETDPRRNRLINARRFGFREILNPRYARERLLQALPLLLWEPDALTDRKKREFLQDQLRTRESNFAGMVRAYHSIWRIFN